MKFIVLAIAVIFFFWFKKSEPVNKEMDLNISVGGLYPENGSTLETGQPIFVELNYEYSYPKEDFYVWVKILDETYDSMYQGSVDKLVPGSGTVERYVHLTEPGQITNIDIVVKTMDFEEVYRSSFEVDYKFEASEEYKALKDDGSGSEITSITFDQPKGTVLKVGDKIVADLEYDINTEEGLDIWVMPETECSNSYEGTMNKESGKGNIQKYFVMGEPCELKKVKLMMKNIVHNTVYEKIIDVDYKFE
jgi:hypothetical protein